jgi:hypothetical protein
LFNSTDATNLPRSKGCHPTVEKHELGTIVWYKVKIGITPRFLAIANSTTVTEIAIIHKQK